MVFRICDIKAFHLLSWYQAWLYLLEYRSNRQRCGPQRRGSTWSFYIYWYRIRFEFSLWRARSCESVTTELCGCPLYQLLFFLWIKLLEFFLWLRQRWESVTTEPFNLIIYQARLYLIIFPDPFWYQACPLDKFICKDRKKININGL